MKVVVYAICKNERAFADRWMASMSEADEVYVLDTGSTDGTPQRLEELGAHVTVETITPWRFDVARNRSLDLVPADADLCVCTDLDEVFQPGWREKVEEAWTPGVDRLLYRYTWNFLPDGREGMVYWYDKMHRRWGCRWVNPVHEVLQFEGGEPQTRYVEGVHLEHHPDQNKSRSQYLPLLELAVEENPENDRNVHYLGREYFFYRRWEESIAMLKRHLALPSATWADERCASMRLLAKELRISVITTKRAYEELEKGGYVYTVPAKGSYVAQQSTQLVREAYLTQIEEHIQEILSLAAACGLGEEEVLDLFRLLWRDQDTEKGDAL